jgi:hypothetical protein
MEAPIPTPRTDDDEDVHWALSTANALWGRGERIEALKWLRRAAEQASDVNADVRALELFKAAADVASKVNPPSAPPPAAATAAKAPPAPAKASAPPPGPAPAPAAAKTPAPPPASGPSQAQVQPPKPSVAPPPGSGSPGAPGAPPMPAARRPPPAPPPRPGSVYPPPPVVPAQASRPQEPGPPRQPVPQGPPPPRPPSIAAPPMPRPSVPDLSRPLQAPPPAAFAPPVAPPARTVAITTVAPPVLAPKRRRSFTGEGRASVERARTAEAGRAHRGPAAAAPAKPRRRTFDDEATVRAQPARAHSEPSFDDLDEDTRVLQTRPGGMMEDVVSRAADLRKQAKTHDEPAPARARLRAQDEAGAGRDEARHAGAQAPADDASGLKPRAPVEPVRDDTTDGPEPASGPASVQTKVWSQMPDMGRAGPETERPPSMVDIAPAPAGASPAPAARPIEKKLDTLPALRVAVLATSALGEVRLIALEGNDDAPPGAALAVLVPLSAADGEAVAKLFRGVE